MKSFQIGKRYRVLFGHSFKVTGRTARTIHTTQGVFNIRLNPYHEEENADVEYVNAGKGTTIENWVSAEDVI